MSKYDNENCWYHGKLRREDAEEILASDLKKTNGLFLVRESNTSIGDYVLSVLYNDQVSHFQIRRHGEDAFFSIDESMKFHGLECLIEHYTQTPGQLFDDIVLTDYVKGTCPPHNSRTHGRTNLLHRATREGNYVVVSEMLKTGYRYDAKNENGQTAVHLASMTGSNEVLRKLIEYGANVNLIDTAGYTPLHYACQNNLPATVRLLVQTGGANIQARNKGNQGVPLHEAASYGHKEVIKELLSLNAPVFPRTENNVTPAMLARMNGHIECAEILEKYKCPEPKTNRTLWYHGTLDRNEAESLIKHYNTGNGTYLLRFSDRNKADVLTLLNDNTFYNYIIREKHGYLFIDNGPYLNSLEHIIEYYSFLSDGLPTILQNPVPPPPKPRVPDISTLSTLKKKKKVAAAVPPIDAAPQTDAENPNVISSQNILHAISFKTEFVANNNNDDSYIHPENLTLEEVIGEGEFASVYKGTYKNKHGEFQTVAIKTLRSDQMENSKEAFLTEAQVMIKLNHHCIVKLIGLSLGPLLRMVQELVPLGSVLQYIDVNRDSINPNYEFKIWAAQIACGMQYLEDNRFVHRDLAARNILLASQVQAKISDFGLSRALGTGREYYRAMKGGKWPLKWYAPESYNYGQFSHKSDVWSFGVTIWEMYSFGDPPYGEMKGTEAIKLIDKGERLDQPPACPDHIYEVMLNCWEYEAESRPAFSELVEFFTSDSKYANLRELVPETELA